MHPIITFDNVSSGETYYVFASPITSIQALPEPLA